LLEFQVMTSWAGKILNNNFSTFEQKVPKLKSTKLEKFLFLEQRKGLYEVNLISGIGFKQGLFETQDL